MASENTQTVSGFIPDPCQQEVIEAQGGFHLVLAPPGCGKTQILTERIRYAHDSEGGSIRICCALRSPTVLRVA